MNGFNGYLTSVELAVQATECEIGGQPATLARGVDGVIAALKALKVIGGTCWLIGNGGSGAVADHIACDLVLKGIRASALTNPALTTSMANDHGLEEAFFRQLETLARDDDVLIGMSCSGESENVALAMAASTPLYRIAMSGFRSANRLRRIACDMQFWTPAEVYGAVQIAHLTILHAAIDLMEISP